MRSSWSFLIADLKTYGLSPHDWTTQLIRYRKNGETFTVQLVHRKDPRLQIIGLANSQRRHWLGLKLNDTDRS